MCCYCSSYPVLPSPAPNLGLSYGYPLYGYGFASYGFPLGYTYVYPDAPGYFAGAPVYPRGEYRVGNCLMVCQ